jgi:hypothetical protein
MTLASVEPQGPKWPLPLSRVAVRIAKDAATIARIERYVQQLPTKHALYQRDARDLSFIPDASVQLVVTSPPY